MKSLLRLVLLATLVAASLLLPGTEQADANSQAISNRWNWGDCSFRGDLRGEAQGQAGWVQSNSVSSDRDCTAVKSRVTYWRGGKSYFTPWSVSTHYSELFPGYNAVVVRNNAIPRVARNCGRTSNYGCGNTWW